jgi:hypothetical protein
MPEQRVPLRPSRLKILLAVGWIVAAVAVTGWTVEQPADAPDPAGAHDPVAAIAGSARLAASQAVEAVPDDSPLLTLVVLAAIGAGSAIVLTIRVARTAVRSAQSQAKLAPSQAVAHAGARARSSRHRAGLAGH